VDKPVQERENKGAETALTVPAHIDAAKDSDDMTTPIRKPSTAPAFQFYTNDFLGSPKVQVMSTIEVGAYWLLLCAEWNAGSLPTDMNRLAATARMKPKPFERLWKGVLGECFIQRGGKLYNDRLESERKKQSDYRKQQKDKADKRWQSHGNATAMPDSGTRHPVGNALLSSSSSSSSSSIKNTHTARASAPIHQTHKNHAACGRVCVPADLHSKFVRALNRDDADKVLRDWYLVVDNDWSVGAHKETPTGADDFAFWRARFDEQWPAPVKVNARVPEWAR